MCGCQYHIGSVVTALVVLLGGDCQPASAQASWLGFRNDTGVPLLVQSATVVNNQLRPGRAHLLYPREVSWESIPLPGKRILIVREARRPNRVLFQDAVLIAGKDLFFSIQAAPPLPPTNTSPARPRVILLPDKPAAPPPGMKPGEGSKR